MEGSRSLARQKLPLTDLDDYWHIFARTKSAGCKSCIKLFADGILHARHGGARGAHGLVLGPLVFQNVFDDFFLLAGENASVQPAVQAVML